MGAQKAEWVEFPRKDSGSILRNPLCGLYKIYRFDISNDKIFDVDSQPIELCRAEESHSLALVEINLKAFSDAELPARSLETVKRIFKFFIANKMQMIVRFLYDWDGVCIQTEPKMLDTIIGHMKQLSPILIEYTDHIYIMQGLFVGNWGEMHGGKFTTPYALHTLYTTLKSCIGTNTYISVRSPALWRSLLKSYDPPLNWDDSGLIKLGIYNDGMMASDTDYGTYGNVHKSEVKALDDRMFRDYEIKFQNELCKFVPNGGEVVNSCSLNNFESAVETMKATRVSYINSEYDEEVLNKWKTVSLSSNWGPWKDKSGYNYIVSHLGYRFSVEKVTVVPDMQREGYLKVELSIKNSGFSACYRKLDLCITVYGDDDNVKYYYPIAADSRLWQPESTVNLTADIDTSPFLTQKIRIALKATEPLSGAYVSFSNTYLSPDSSGNSLLGFYTPKDVM